MRSCDLKFLFFFHYKFMQTPGSKLPISRLHIPAARRTQQDCGAGDGYSGSEAGKIARVVFSLSFPLWFI